MVQNSYRPHQSTWEWIPIDVKFYSQYNVWVALFVRLLRTSSRFLAVSISMNIVPTKYFGEHDEHKESHCCGQKIAPYLQRPHISSSDCAPEIQCFSIPVNI